ncbi:Rid family hydrolase [Bradyrhizobium sp.]|uniref:Rid family hydrolase n=1 Tax=Bradyrhizobium sp. TaxID=376 RepID=UPI0039E2A329
MRPIAHFSHASRIENVIHVGASAGVYPDLRLAGDERGRVDMEAQTRRMFANLRTTLALLGGDISDVVRLKAYVADVRDIPKYLAVYADEFRDARPAHSVVGSWDFPLPQAAVEIDTTAIVGGQPSVTPNAGLSALAGATAGAVVAGEWHHASALPIGKDGQLAERGTEGQISAVLQNLETLLGDAGFGIADLCNLHVTISDIRDHDLVVRAFAQFFGDRFPTWTVVGAPLERPEFRIGVESVAVRGGGQPISSALSPRVPGQAAPAILAGDTLFLSGQGTPDDADTSVELQARSAWKRLHALVEAAGFPQDSLLRTNNVLTDWRDFQGFNRGYGPNVAEPYVPRATVLGNLPDRRARVQTEGIAHRHGHKSRIVQVAPLVKQTGA